MDTVKYSQKKKQDFKLLEQFLCLSVTDEKALLSSYRAAYHMAKEKMVHIIAENIILPN